MSPRPRSQQHRRPGHPLPSEARGPSHRLRRSTLSPGRKPPTSRRNRVARVLHEHGYGLVRDLLIALLAVAVTFTLESRIATRQEVLENLGFVRERSGTDDPKPFRSMLLSGSSLSGLRLGCPEPGLESCATFDRADIRGADLGFADLSNASLREVNLSEANLLSADLRGADLTRANLTRAFLRNTDLTDADLTEVCFDDSTTWPDGFPRPAAARCDS